MALSVSDGEPREVPVYDWARDVMQQLTHDRGNDGNSLWTPDGKRIVFQEGRDKNGSLSWANADGSGEVSRWTESSSAQ